ncbi:NTP transferase domain-containing protein [bacterium]|nr:NTP transferase domain-containing protein [bacterium]
MKCLIIAAGRGSRLSPRGDSKPLIPLLGLPIIERAILTAKVAGLADFYIVTGHNGEKVRRFLDGLAQKRALRITHVINDDWERDNGLSVLKAKSELTGDFVLLMADHIFDEQVLVKLRKKTVGDGDVILAVDYRIKGNQNVDIDDVTKVLVEDNSILNIGKNLKEYNAYDTGAFLCSTAIFAALEDSVSSGDSTLSGGIRAMVKEGKAKALDIGEHYWIDVDDEKAFRNAERVLLASLKKPTDGPVSRRLNRPISTRITKLLLRTRIPPNAVSLASFGVGILGGVFFFLGGYINLAIGGILAQLSSIIDGCDGEVARLKSQVTEFGGWFDAVLDRYADAFLLLGLTWHVCYRNASLTVILLGFLAIIGTLMNSYTADKYDGFMKKKLSSKGHYFRIGRDVRMFTVFLGALFNQPVATLGLIALVMNIENARRVVLLYRHEHR